MTDGVLSLEDIVFWYQLKQQSLAGSGVAVVGIKERTEDVPAAAADFNGIDAMGRINGWVSGEFDFEVVRVSDGTDQFWKHIKVSSFEELEAAYSDFIESMLNQGAVVRSA
jgi:hypothetical protein